MSRALDLMAALADYCRTHAGRQSDDIVVMIEGVVYNPVHVSHGRLPAEGNMRVVVIEVEPR